MAFNYEINKHIATLSDHNGYTLEVNVISFNGAEPKLDIRRWNRGYDKMLKGVALSEKEVVALKEALSSTSIENGEQDK